MIKEVLDTLIPADTSLKMPSASEIDFHAYEEKYEIKEITIDFLDELTKASTVSFSKFFIDLNKDQRKEVLNMVKFKNIRLFSIFLEHVFKAYYSDISVLSSLEVGSLPPFPEGNIIEDDDWSILMPVYERGTIYREVDNN